MASSPPANPDFLFYRDILASFKPIFQDCIKDIGHCLDEIDVFCMIGLGANLSFDKSE